MQVHAHVGHFNDQATSAPSQELLDDHLAMHHESGDDTEAQHFHDSSVGQLSALITEVAHPILERGGAGSFLDLACPRPHRFSYQLDRPPRTKH
jgi:hypothetical protein